MKKRMLLNPKRKAVCLMIATAMLLCMLPSTAFAEVIFTTEEEASDKYVGITGNPDFYPYEYYNSETGEYEGVFPELYSLISEKSGLDFEYIDCGTTDKRLVDEKTGYAQIISAYAEDDKEMSKYLMSNAVPVVSYEQDGEEVTICFAFGKYADAETIEKVTKAMDSISDEEITSLLGKYVNAQSTGTDYAKYIAIIIALIIIIAIAVIILTRLLLKEGLNKHQMKKKELLDPLTGIGNKKYFEEQFNKLAAYQYKASYVIAHVGFDIRKVNKYYGDEKAEEQLCYAAQLLTSEGKKQELAARISGGAFGVLHICSTEAEARDWAAELLSRLNTYNVQFDKDYTPKFRAGVYRLQSGNWDFNKAVKNALKCYDMAVFNDSDVFVSNESMEKQEQLNEVLSHDISKAFEEHQIVQFLQPIVSAETENIIGAESLVRWQHPKMGLLLPKRFVQMMIDEGKVVELDMYLFEESCRKLAKWKAEGKRYRISTNFTRVSITTEGYVDRVGMIASKYDFERKDLVIEITEDSLENNKEIAMDNMKAIKELGFKIALDDLGSGFTFFSDLKDYPLDIIKMDRDLLLDAVDEKGKALMEGLIKVCKDMGMEIICEGVETREQCEMVKNMGCTYIQGYYYYKPMSYEEAAKFM